MAVLDFHEISKVPFKKILQTLNMTYEETEREYRGQFEDGKTFIISKEKNIFKTIGADERKWSPIHFYAYVRGLGLRPAAEAILGLSRNSEEKSEEYKIPELELKYCKALEEAGITQDQAIALKIGLVVNHRGTMAAHLACRIEEDGQLIGYLGVKDKKLNVPKSIKARQHVAIPVAFLDLIKLS